MPDCEGRRVKITPFGRVTGRGMGESVIWAFGGETVMVCEPAMIFVKGPNVWTAMGVLETIIVWPGAMVEPPMRKSLPEGAGLTMIGELPAVTVAMGG